jgi:hypothetical protein
MLESFTRVRDETMTEIRALFSVLSKLDGSFCLLREER